MADFTVLESCGLVLSNLVLLPLIFYCIRNRWAVETVLLTILFYISSSYHICQTTDVCVLTLEAHRYADYISVYSTTVWMILLLLRLEFVTHVCVFILVQSLLTSCVLHYGTSFSAVIPLGVTLLLVCSLRVLRVKEKIIDIRSVFFSSLIAFSGIFLFLIGGSYDSLLYPATHSVWHLYGMPLLFYVPFSIQRNLRKNKREH